MYIHNTTQFCEDSYVKIVESKLHLHMKPKELKTCSWCSIDDYSVSFWEGEMSFKKGDPIKSGMVILLKIATWLYVETVSLSQKPPCVFC